MKLERLQQDKISPTLWADKQEELKYNQELYDQLKDLCADNVTYKEIAAMFPELVHFLPKEEKEKFRSNSFFYLLIAFYNSYSFSYPTMYRSLKYFVSCIHCVSFLASSGTGRLSLLSSSVVLCLHHWCLKNHCLGSSSHCCHGIIELKDCAVWCTPQYNAECILYCSFYPWFVCKSVWEKKTVLSRYQL